MSKKRSARSATNRHDLALAYLGARHIKDVRMRSVVDRHFVRVLDATDGNLSLAAELLGVNRRTMQRYTRRRAGRS